MKRVVGFAMFFIALGMLVELLLVDDVICILIMLICLCLSYHFFCSK